MYKTINAADILAIANRGETIYMVIPVEGSTTVDELNKAEAFVRVEPEGAKVENTVIQLKPETPEQPTFPRKKVDTGKLKALYRAGWTPARIADELGCTAQTVRDYMKKLDNGEEI